MLLPVKLALAPKQMEAVKLGNFIFSYTSFNFLTELKRQYRGIEGNLVSKRHVFFQASDISAQSNW